jgi:phage shock protein PspC (stress-responsive transcriptional regulator)
MQVNRRLYRCRHDRRIAGVAAGVAEYFDLDPTLVRVVWFLSIFFGGLGLFLYVAMALIVPLEPLTADEAAAAAAVAASAPMVGPDGAVMPAEPHRHLNPSRGDGRWTTVFGIVLILLGAVALADVAMPAIAWWHYFWPLALLAIGGVLIARAVRHESSGG